MLPPLNSAEIQMRKTSKKKIVELKEPHAWRLCPDGEHWVREHPMRIPQNRINPSNNISAGIRWLFRKRAIASSLLKRAATWEEAIAEFKGVRTTTKARAAKLMGEFNRRLQELKKCGKP